MNYRYYKNNWTRYQASIQEYKKKIDSNKNYTQKNYTM